MCLNLSLTSDLRAVGSCTEKSVSKWFKLLQSGRYTNTVYFTQKQQRKAASPWWRLEVQWCSTRVKKNVTHVNVWRCSNIGTHCLKESVQALTPTLWHTSGDVCWVGGLFRTSCPGFFLTFFHLFIPGVVLWDWLVFTLGGSFVSSEDSEFLQPHPETLRLLWHPEASLYNLWAARGCLAVSSGPVGPTEGLWGPPHVSWKCRLWKSWRECWWQPGRRWEEYCQSGQFRLAAVSDRGKRTDPEHRVRHLQPLRSAGAAAEASAAAEVTARKNPVEDGSLGFWFWCPLCPLCLCSGSGPGYFPLGQIQMTIRHSSQRNKLIVVVHACRCVFQRKLLFVFCCFGAQEILPLQEPDRLHRPRLRPLRSPLPPPWQTEVGQEKNSHAQEKPEPALRRDVSTTVLTRGFLQFAGV